MPKEHKFFEMFSALAAKIQEGVAFSEEMVNKFDDLEARAKRVKDIEHDCDQLTHETLAFLNSTFITPFDREHIHALVTKMDDVMDHVESAVQLLVLYKIETPSQDLKYQVRLVKKSVDVMAKSVVALEHMKKTRAVLDHCVEINTLENEGDVIMQQAMARLFDDKADALQVIKWKGIYENFEDALDACEDVANVIETVVLENA